MSCLALPSLLSVLPAEAALESLDVLGIAIDLRVCYSADVAVALAILSGGLLWPCLAGEFIERCRRRTPIGPYLHRPFVRTGRGVVPLITIGPKLDTFRRREFGERHGPRPVKCA